MSTTILEYNAYQGVPFFNWGANTYAVTTPSGNIYESSGVLTLGSVSIIVPYPSALISVTIGNTVTSISSDAFLGCNALATVTFSPTSILTTIGQSAFQGCSALNPVTLPSTLQTIGILAFYLCIALQTIAIPDSVTTIGSGAFSGCSILNPVSLPSTLQTIDSSVFSNCTALQAIAIPNSVTSIGQSAFQNSGLHTVTISQTSSLLTSIGNSAFAQCPFTSITIPNSVQTIGNSAFASCFSLQSIAIPNSVTSIGNSAFQSCSVLNTVTISQSSSSLHTIGDLAFTNSPFTSITIPDSVTSISLSAFQSSGLSNNGPIGAITIDQQTLNNLPGFTVTFPQNFFGAINVNLSVTNMSTTTILVYNGTQGASFNWDGVTYTNTIGNSYESTTSTTSVGSGNPVPGIPTQLTSVTFGSVVTSIGNGAFNGCTALNPVTLPSTLVTIGNAAFQNCISLATVTFSPGSQLVTIGSNAFASCSALTSITIPDLVTIIGISAFNSCSSLHTVTISQTSSLLQTIGNSAFTYCPLFTSITIPNSVTSIGPYAFAFCTGLQSIAIPNSVTSINLEAFDGCSALNLVTISQSSSSLQTIGNAAFRGCPFISITIPDSFQINGATIGPSAFSNSGLNSNGPSGAVTIDQLTINSLGIQGDILGSTASPFYGATNVLLSITCYEANTLILILENNEEVYKKVSKLKVGDLVKTYKKGYKKIKLLHSFKYKPPSGIKGLNMLYKHKENGVIITGGHSILVDELTEQEKINNLKQCGFNKTIEDKKLLLACSSDKFKKIDDCCKEYHLFHFSLETDDPKEHFGVYITDGILSESCPKDALLRMVSKRAIIKNVVRKMH